MVLKGVPEPLRSDNFPEFITKVVRKCLADRGAKTLTHATIAGANAIGKASTQPEKDRDTERTYSDCCCYVHPEIVEVEEFPQQSHRR